MVNLPSWLAAVNNLRSSLTARFQSTPALVESGLHGHDSELPIFDFPVCGHHPNEVDRMTGHRNIWVKAFRHNHRVAVVHYTDELRLVRVRVDELYPKGRRRHV